MANIIIFGNGPVAKTAYYKLTHDSPHEVAAFAIDPAYLKEETLFDLPVIPFPDLVSRYPPADYKILIAVGYVKLNQIRAERYQQAKEMGYQFVNHISSGAIVAPEIIMGENCMINTQTIVSPFAEIGNNVIIGSGSFIGHDVVVKDHCFIGDRVAIAGSVIIEPYCFLGISSTIRNKVTIARECIIGAGSLILQNTQEKEVYMGKASEPLPITSDKLAIS